MENIENPNTSRNSNNKISDPKFVQKLPSENNQRLIELYGRRYDIGAKFSKVSRKAVTSCLTTWGVAPSSVISNDDIELEFEEKSIENDEECKVLQYAIIVKNKTDHTLYIDRGNSYRVSKDENFCYYNSGTQISTSHKSGGGMSIGIGSIANAAGIGGVLGTIAQGISVGGGVSSSTGMTIGQQRFLVLPPHGRAALAKDNEIKGEKLDRNESFAYLMSEINPPIHKGEVLNYDEGNTPYAIDYIITYSDNQNFTTYSVINTKIYIKQIFGTQFSQWSPGFGTFEAAVKRRISGVDKYCIIGYIGEDKVVRNLFQK